jgi:acyl-CoA synthetase (NDP forming)
VANLDDPIEARTPLERMLEARSVAVVGASVRQGSLGAQMMAELRRGGFEGAVYPVNPGYEEVDGFRCYASIDDVPGPVDLAILGVSNVRIERALGDAAAAGAASAVTFSSLFEAAEDKPAPDAPPLIERLGTIARDHGMALCGGNGMGFLNEEHHLRATGFLTPEELRHGPVTFLSHSGSAFAAVAFNDRGIGFNLLVSSGQEFVTTMADYMEYALGLDSTRVLALLLETVRDPEKFRAQLARAADRSVAVLALKVGRTEGSKRLVTAHSGGLAGEHGAYEALFDAYGVHQIRTMDELADAMELFSSPRRVRKGTGIATVHDSGGERAMFVDIADDLGVPFARVNDVTIGRIQEALDPGLEATNPLDAWGTGIDADAIFRSCFAAFADDPDVAASAFVIDMTRQGEPYSEGYLQVARDAWFGSTIPFCILSNLASAVATEEAGLLRDDGIPILEGTESGLRALRHLLHDAKQRALVAVAPPAPVNDEVRERWRVRLAEPAPFSELEGLAMLQDYGVRVVAAREASALEGVLEAAEAIGYPVALKTAAPGVQHKSDVGGVRLRLDRPAELQRAYEDLATRLGPAVVIAEMAPEGVEVALGILRDATFGPLVMVAAGGVLVELLKDRRLGLPPLDETHARRLIDELQMRPMLDGFRGGPSSDIASLADALSRLSVLAADLGELLDAIDVNPIIVGSDGCVAVDALVVPRTT